MIQAGRRIAHPEEVQGRTELGKGGWIMCGESLDGE